MEREGNQSGLASTERFCPSESLKLSNGERQNAREKQVLPVSLFASQMP